MICVMLYVGQCFSGSLLPYKLPRFGCNAKSGSQRFHKKFQFELAAWRNLRTGTFCASEGEPRTSVDISKWTDRYSIPSGHSVAFSAS